MFAEDLHRSDRPFHQRTDHLVDGQIQLGRDLGAGFFSNAILPAITASKTHSNWANLLAEHRSWKLHGARIHPHAQTPSLPLVSRARLLCRLVHPPLRYLVSPRTSVGTQGRHDFANRIYVSSCSRAMHYGGSLCILRNSIRVPRGEFLVQICSVHLLLTSWFQRTYEGSMVRIGRASIRAVMEGPLNVNFRHFRWKPPWAS